MLAQTAEERKRGSGRICSLRLGGSKTMELEWPHFLGDDVQGPIILGQAPHYPDKWLSPNGDTVSLKNVRADDDVDHRRLILHQQEDEPFRCLGPLASHHQACYFQAGSMIEPGQLV